MVELSVSRVAELARGRVEGNADRVVRGVAPLDSAGPDHLSFVANPKYLPYLQDTRAGAVLVPASSAEEAPASLTRIVVNDPHVALARVLPALYPAEERAGGIHPTAVVADGVKLGEGVEVGPYVVIGRGARLGDRCRVGSHVVVERDCVIGDDCTLHPHATLHHGVVLGDRCIVHSGARIGREGFGFVWMDGGHRRVPQVGGCRLGDDVEVGANSTIDRGSIGDTVIGRGTKIDNLVHIGHNARLGEHVLLIAQVGIAGSTTVGDGAVLAGQVGVAGHLSIGAGARVAAQGGVIGDVPDGETYSGYPARPHREAMRAHAAAFRLPGLLRRIQKIERALFGGAND